MIQCKWECSLTRVVRASLLSAPVGAAWFLRRPLPYRWFAILKVRAEFNAHSLVGAVLSPGLEEVLSPITRKEAGLGNQRF